jgi:hypothetical protein
MTNINNLQMHQEHQTWKSDDDMWRDDVRVWEEEVQAAQKDIARVQAALAEHLRILQKHAAAIRLYEGNCDRHEHAIVNCERGSAAAQSEAMKEAHPCEADKHEDLRAAHERIKRHHHTRLAHWNLLVKALEAPL